MLQNCHDEVLSLTAELVALCERDEVDPGPLSGHTYLTAEEYVAAAAEIAKNLGDRPIWVFAYGSLLWKPEFAAVESRVGVLQGWRRSFCLELHRWRGNPLQPGLMLGLKRGGACQGLVLRADVEIKVPLLVRLLQRETLGPKGLKHLHVIPVETSEGPVLALVFWAEASMDDPFPEYSVDAAATVLASACGHIGSCADYLLKTVEALRTHGIHDEYMWDMQRRVAEQIRGRIPAP